MHKSRDWLQNYTVTDDTVILSEGAGKWTKINWDWSLESYCDNTKKNKEKVISTFPSRIHLLWYFGWTDYWCGFVLSWYFSCDPSQTAALRCPYQHRLSSPTTCYQLTCSRQILARCLLSYLRKTMYTGFIVIRPEFNTKTAQNSGKVHWTHLNFTRDSTKQEIISLFL